MNFQFNLVNHNRVGQRSLEDVIGIMAHQLRALGHTAYWEPGNETLLLKESGINIIVEGFTDKIIDALAALHAQGARYIILATEEPTPEGFNHGRSSEMRLRQRNFPRAAALCEGILHLVPGQHVTDWYARFAPAAQADLGYAPTLVRPDDFEPDFDFAFFGSVTERRLRILKRLAKRVGTPNAVKIEGDFTSQHDRDQDMRRGKVIIQIRKFDEMGLVSSSRCNTSLHLGRPILAEPHAMSRPWDEVVRFADSLEAFLDEACMMRLGWRGAHARQFAAFKERMTPRYCVGEPLERIGVLRRFNQAPSVLLNQAPGNMRRHLSSHVLT